MATAVKFSQGFLDAYPNFNGNLSAAEVTDGERLYAVWQRAQESMRKAIEVRAQVERRSGRIEVADALEAACSPLAIQCTSLTDY